MNADFSSLAGSVQLYPGPGVPESINSTRRNWAALLTRGKKAVELPSLLGSLYNMCGHSHFMCSQLALGAASGEPPVMPSAQIRLQRETALEHIRRISLDWPRLLSSQHPQSPDPVSERQASLQENLARCPLLRDSETSLIPSESETGTADSLRPTRDWLESTWIGMPATQWLEAWHHQPSNWLLDWTAQTDNWLTGIIRDALEFPAVELTGARGAGQSGDLRWSTESEQAVFAQLAEQLLNDDQFSLYPMLDGHCAQTGTWTRHFDTADAPDSLTGQIGFRIADLLRLCLPDTPGEGGSQWLASGALQTGANQGIAWLEMARGLLIHAVQLDSSALATARVANCQVLAPTEWNFHPKGAVAMQLQSVEPDDTALKRRIGLLMAAFDPCVPFCLPATDTDTVPSDVERSNRTRGSHARS